MLSRCTEKLISSSPAVSMQQEVVIFACVGRVPRRRRNGCRENVRMDLSRKER
jgi:hypothetical protein